MLSSNTELHAADPASYTDIDSDAVITGICDHTIGTGGSTTGIGYRLQGRGTAGGPAQPEMPERHGYIFPVRCDLRRLVIMAMIDQGVTATLAARDANRNGDDSHIQALMGSRGMERWMFTIGTGKLEEEHRFYKFTKVQIQLQFMREMYKAEEQQKTMGNQVGNDQGAPATDVCEVGHVADKTHTPTS
ncbi:hypothetical protein Tco_0971202 [Tanacetum coccineum]